jgi:hypothetical protein
MSNEALTKDSAVRQLVAHEPDEREIEKTFRDLPWCRVIVTPTKNVFRSEWKRVVA